MKLNLESLEKCFNDAKKNGKRYVGIRVNMSNFTTDEIIINEYPNFDKKLDYYKGAYTNELVLKSFNGIKIVGFVAADDFKGIEDELLGGKR